jgi:hypothetical protein
MVRNDRRESFANILYLFNHISFAKLENKMSKRDNVLDII